MYKSVCSEVLLVVTAGSTKYIVKLYGRGVMFIVEVNLKMDQGLIYNSAMQVKLKVFAVPHMNGNAMAIRVSAPSGQTFPMSPSCI